MNKKIDLTLFCISIILPLFFFTPNVCKSQRLSKGSGDFIFFTSGNTPIKVWYHKPGGLNSDSSIVFVMHGLKRNGQTYRNSWIKHADRGKFILIVPEFSKEYYPKSRNYNLGNMITKHGHRQDKSEWTFTVIEQVFDEIKSKNLLTANNYYIYGHSAGAQFVHRYIMFMPQARVKMAIAANAGWYTFPRFDIKFPYGLNQSGLKKEKLLLAFSQQLTILLGTEDNDPHHKYLRRKPGAMAQGKHRLERGHTFFKAAIKEAETNKTWFNWKLEEVIGVGHSNKRMSYAAADLIIKNMKK